LAVRAKGNGTAHERVGLRGEFLPPRGRIPDLDGAVIAIPGEPPGIGTKPGPAGIPQLLVVERRDFTPRRRVPNLDRAIATGRQEVPAVGSERYAPNLPRVIGKNPDQAIPGRPLLRGNVPESHRPIGAGRRQGSAIRAERHLPGYLLVVLAV